jgi:endoglucanase
MPSSLGSSTKTSSPDHTDNPVRFVHTISEAGRLLPSASRWNSIEIDFNLIPQSATAYDSLPSRYSKSVDYDLIITDISVSIALAILLLVLLIHFLPHKHAHNASSQNLTLAVNQALTFFDAQKCNTMHSIKYI